MANYFRNENFEISKAQKKWIEYKPENSECNKIDCKIKRCFIASDFGKYDIRL